MGKRRGRAFRIRDAPVLDHLLRAVERLALRKVKMAANVLGELTADAHHRMQRRHRILKEHGEVPAAPGPLTLQRWTRRDQVAIGQERVRYRGLSLAKRMLGDAGYERVPVVMERGQIAEQGSHAQLMELGGLYARLHNQVRSSTPGEPQI